MTYILKTQFKNHKCSDFINYTQQNIINYESN